MKIKNLVVLVLEWNFTARFYNALFKSTVCIRLNHSKALALLQIFRGAKMQVRKKNYIKKRERKRGGGGSIYYRPT